MAQIEIIDYLGAMLVEPSKAYTYDMVIAKFPTADILIMKDLDVLVSINGTDMFKTSFDDISKLTSGKSYIFSKRCTVAVGIKAVI